MTKSEKKKWHNANRDRDKRKDENANRDPKTRTDETAKRRPHRTQQEKRESYGVAARKRQEKAEKSCKRA